MRYYALEDITLKLPSPPSHSLGESSHLFLEISEDNKFISKLELLSRGSSSGIWNTVVRLVCGEDEKLMLSACLKLGVDEHQLLGSVELDGPELCDRLGEEVEFPLVGGGNVVLTMKVATSAGILAGPASSGQANERAIATINALIDSFNKLSAYQRAGRLESLEQAISRLQLAAEMSPEDDSKRLAVLQNLGASLFLRFERLGSLDDLDNSITQLQAAVNPTSDDHPMKPACLSSLGRCLQVRFHYSGDMDDLVDSIARHQAAVDLTPDGHPLKHIYLNNLESSFRTRFQRFGGVDDLSNSIARRQKVIDITPDSHPNKPMSLNNLGESLRVRFEHLGAVEDLSSAIARGQEAVDLTADGHIHKPEYLGNLGKAFQTRFEHFGNVGDLDNAISRQQAAVDLTSDGHISRAVYLSDLASSLHARFERFGDIGDLDSAIAQRHIVIDLTPDDHLNKPMYLNGLGVSYRLRFERFGNVDDLNNAIVREQAAVDLAPDDDPHKRMYLGSLGSSLHSRFQRFGQFGDIDKAIARMQAALDLTSDHHPSKPTYLNNLGILLQSRFDRFGDVADLNNAIARKQAAVDFTPDIYPGKPTYLNNLGMSLLTRFKRFGKDQDLNNSLARHQAAVDLIPDVHPDKPGHLSNLGNALFARFLHHSYTRDAEAAIALYSAAADFPIGSPSERFTAAKNWIRAASVTKHLSLLAAYERALAIIPFVAWLGLPITGRYQHLIQLGAIARDAAATAISFREYNKAVEWLEQGRSIVWTQILQLRTSVDQLRNVEPNLADQLQQVSRQLDGGIKRNHTEDGEKLSLEEEGRRYRALAKKWEGIVDEVRSSPGFQDFLKPPRISQLISAAKNGPVIVLNVAENQCDALALIDGMDEVMHIPLPNFTSKKAIKLQADLKFLLASSGIRLRAIREPEFEDGGDAECRRILAELWNSLVKPVLECLAFNPHPDTLPRIWWCVTGPLAFLPIHAAGLYDQESSGNQIQDYVVSSYIPTVSSLIESSTATIDHPFKMLSVIEPSTGRYYIPNTEVELGRIRSHLKDRDHFVLKGPDATKERVTKAMKDSNWLHLACHGSQNVRNPTKSSLKLRGDDLLLEEIIKLNLPKAEFAFLSACQTVTGEETLSDEAVHIAGGMLLAGYRSVVATMWSIEDKLAPEVADEFYRHLLEDGGRPNNRKAAEALHVSVQKLRKQPGIRMVSWIPFVHLGY